MIHISFDSVMCARNEWNSAFEPCLTCYNLEKAQSAKGTKLFLEGPSVIRWCDVDPHLRLITTENVRIITAKSSGSDLSQPRVKHKHRIYISHELIAHNSLIRYKLPRKDWRPMLRVFPASSYQFCHELKINGPCMVYQGTDHGFDNVGFTTWIETDYSVERIRFDLRD